MRRILTLIGSLVLVVGLAVPAAGGPDRITYGDARSQFNASTTGGRVIQFGNQTPAVIHASPLVTIGSGPGVRPFPGGPWDGASFCVDDWHVMLSAFFDGGDQSFKLQDALDSLGTVEIEWTLDGQVITETERTPIKRFLEPEGFGFERAYGFQDGFFVAPGELSVGSHSLQMTIDPDTDPLTFEITFNIDASGTGACV